MHEYLLQILSGLYAVTGAIGLLAYWPTIQDLYHHKKPSANIPSYIMWTLTGGIALLYVIFVIPPDLLLILVTGMHFLACLIVWILSAQLKNSSNDE